MIAIFRVRFATNTNPSTVLPDAAFANWLDPAIPFSLGNYWAEASWGQFDLRYQLFPTMVMPDPGRITLAMRQGLVDGVIAQATASFAPFWDEFDIVMVWFAQTTDMFGGGSFNLPLRAGGTKKVTATVVDINSPFSGAGQELGHAFGFQHEIDAGRNEYGSPYSVMSARAESCFVRPADPRLPDGPPIVDPKDPFVGHAPGRVVPPGLTPAQLLFFPWFQNPQRVVTVPATFTKFPAKMKLFALDHARARSQSAVLPVMAVLPPSGMTGYWYTVELRRKGTLYDQAIGAAGGPPEGLVVHSITTEGRVRYEGVLPLSATNGDLDWTSVARLFTLRLVGVGPNNEWVEFDVMNGPFQQQRRVNLDNESDQATEHKGPWESVLFDQPCVRGVFSFRQIKTDHRWILFAASYGFEAPKYRWYFNDIRLPDQDPFLQVLTVQTEVFVPAPPVGADPPGGDFLTVDITFQYRISGNRLEINLVNAPGNFTATVRVVAFTDASVDPFQVDAERYLPAKCLRYEWEQAYKDKLHECYDWMDAFVDSERSHILVDPGDPPSFHLNPEEIETVLRTERAMHAIRSTHPERAAQMLTYLVQRFNVPRAVLTARMGARGTGQG